MLTYLPTYLPTDIPTYIPTDIPTYIPTYLQHLKCIFINSLPLRSPKIFSLSSGLKKWFTLNTWNLSNDFLKDEDISFG